MRDYMSSDRIIVDALKLAHSPVGQNLRPATDTEIAPELTGHGLPLSKCEAYNRVYDQF